jgi:hypothetical protein
MHFLSRPWTYNPLSHRAPASHPLNLFSELRSEVPLSAILSNYYILLSLSLVPSFRSTYQSPKVHVIQDGDKITLWYTLIFTLLENRQEKTCHDLNVIKHSTNLMCSQFISDFHLDFLLSFPNISSSPDFCADLSVGLNTIPKLDVHCCLSFGGGWKSEICFLSSVR